MRVPYFILLAIGLTGCSGAERQDVLGGASPSTGSSGTNTSGGTSGSSGTVPPGTSSGQQSSGTIPTGNCDREEEPNDGKNQANVLAPARCGTLSQKDQRDFLTFQLQPTTSTLAINFTGDVRLDVTVPGQGTVTLTRDSFPAVDFVRGERYFIEVRPLGDIRGDLEWRVEVIEK